jgi:hypothetical protein
VSTTPNPLPRAQNLTTLPSNSSPSLSLATLVRTANEKKKKLEDSTFGLKNKNKSAKVGAFVNQQTHQIFAANSKDAKAKEEMKRKKIAGRNAAKAAEEERDALFGAALMATVSKTSVS